MDYKLIDGKWPLEGFVDQTDAKAGFKWGYVGLGQGGGKMVDAFASIKNPKTGEQIYPCIVANSNLGDMANLKNIPARLKFGMEGFENGVGKDPEVGEQAFLGSGEKIFEAIANEMGDCQMILVVASLGGGTGTGAINVLVDAIISYLGIPAIAATSLPIPNEIESRNAYNALNNLVEKFALTYDEEQNRHYRKLESLIILDNDKIIKEHLTEPEVTGLTWDYYSNYKLASILHEWSVLTSLGSDFTVDVADLMNHILTGGGVLTFAKKKINLDEFKNNEDLIQEIVSTYRGKNVLANGFNYEKDMRSMALVVVMPKGKADLLNQDTLERIRGKIKESLPNVNFYPGSVTNNSARHAIVYTMASMAGLPERARNLREEAQSLYEQRIESEKAATGFNMGDKLNIGSPKTSIISGTPGMKKGNPFAQKEVAASAEGKKEAVKQAGTLFKSLKKPN